MLENRDMNCNICGCNESSVFSKAKDSDSLHPLRVKCIKCGLVHSYPQASIKRLKEYYTNFYAGLGKNVEEQDLIVKNQTTKIRKRFEGRVGRKFLDIGCGTGNVVEIAIQSGMDGYGVELSKRYCDYATKVKGLQNIYYGELTDIGFNNEFFDYIEMWHVIEHIQDPMNTLKETYRILKKDGEIVIATPNIDYVKVWSHRISSKIKGKIPYHYSSDEHTFEFSKKTLQRMLEKCGFKIIEIRFYQAGIEHKLKTPTDLNWKGIVESFFLEIIKRVFPNTNGFYMSFLCQKLNI